MVVEVKVGTNSIVLKDVISASNWNTSYLNSAISSRESTEATLKITLLHGPKMCVVCLHHFHRTIPQKPNCNKTKNEHSPTQWPTSRCTTFNLATFTLRWTCPLRLHRPIPSPCSMNSTNMKVEDLGSCHWVHSGLTLEYGAIKPWRPPQLQHTNRVSILSYIEFLYTVDTIDRKLELTRLR